MKTIDDLVNESSKFLNEELAKIPISKLNTLRTLTNIYIMDCLEGNTKGMESQRKRIERYMGGLSKRYDVNTSYFKQMLSIIESYYTTHTRRAVYRGKGG